MRRLIALLLCFFVPAVAFAAAADDKENSYKVMYDGG